MRVADILRELGRPIAYFPFLSRYLGSINATVLFCQVFYWQDKAASDLGVYKTIEELNAETGLSYEEQRAARTALRACGVLVETRKRIEHRIYFKIDEDALERLLSSPPPEKKPRKKRAKKAEQPPGKSPGGEMGKVQVGNWEKSNSGNGKSPTGELDNSHVANQEIPNSRPGESLDREEGNSQVVNCTETTAEITSETTAAAASASAPVDNSAAAAAANSTDEKPGNRPAPSDDIAPPNAEAALLAVLAESPNCAIDPKNDRIHVLTWVGKGVTPMQLADALKRATARREADTDDRPIYAKFLDRFVGDVLAGGTSDAAAEADAPPAQWWLSDSGIGAQGKRVRVARLGPHESTPEYLVRVAKASGRGPWVSHVLKSWQGTSRYPGVVAYLDDVLPPDFGQ